MFTDMSINLISDLIAIPLLYLAWQAWEARRFAGWKLVIVRDGKVLKSRLMSQAKAKQVLADDSDMSVYVKGVISPYAWLNVDVLDLLKRDRHTKTVTADISGQPLPRGGTS